MPKYVTSSLESPIATHENFCGVRPTISLEESFNVGIDLQGARGTEQHHGGTSLEGQHMRSISWLPLGMPGLGLKFQRE